MTLITASIVIYKQLSYLENKNLGFDKEKVVVIPFKNLSLLSKFDAIKNELLAINGVSHVSATSNIPGGQFNQNSFFSPDDPQNRISTSEVYIDYDFFDLLGIEFSEGRKFSKEYPNDVNSSFVLNEMAVKSLRQGDLIGKEITWDWDGGSGPLKGTVIGIVKDFNFQSLHQPLTPLLFKLSTGFNHILVKLQSENYNNQIREIEKVYKSFESNFGFEYSFLSDDMQQQYVGEQKTAEVFTGFSIIAVVIACVGLFALASLSYSHRMKEISIRKVLGAETISLLRLLLKDYTRLIVIAVFLGLPIAWLLAKNWLQNFTYRIDLKPVDFIISGIVLMVIAWGTLGYLTFKTARANPIESLKEE